MGESPKEVVVLAIDVEKSGCTLEDIVFGVGAAVVDMSGKVLDSYLGYNYNPKFVEFEPRCWAFWGKEEQKSVLKSLERPASTFAEYRRNQSDMGRGFFEFLAKWQANDGYSVWVVTDTCGFDHESINQLLLRSVLENEYMPLPYWNGSRRPWTTEDTASLPPRPDGTPHLRAQSVTAPFGMMRSTTSLIHGFLMGRGVLKPTDEVWSLNKALRSAFPDLPESPASHTHDPRDDAIDIAFLLIQVFRLCGVPT